MENNSSLFKCRDIVIPIINRYETPIQTITVAFLTASVLTNILSLIIFTRPSFRKVSISFYMIIMSCFCILQPYSILTEKYERNLSGALKSSEIACKIYYYLSNTLVRESYLHQDHKISIKLLYSS